jgi:hypothetical protein
MTNLEQKAKGENKFPELKMIKKRAEQRVKRVGGKLIAIVDD